MARKVVQKTSFLGGEAGYLLEGRSDLAQFQLGCSKLQNMIALKGGSVTRRPGTRYVKGTEANQPARIVPFVTSYDSGDSIYVVEITKPTTTSLAFRVIRTSDNTVYTPANSPWLGGIGFQYISANLNLDDIQIVQSADILFMVADGMKPMLLRRLTATTFDLVDYIDRYQFNNGSLDAQYGMPFRDPNVSAITLTPSVTTGSGTLTASAAFFKAGHVGTYFRIQQGTSVGYVFVVSFVSSTVVNITVSHTLGATTATDDWAEGAWSEYRGFPKSVAFYNQRLVFGGNTSQPDTFWASQSFDYFQMKDDPATPSVGDPQTFTLASQRLNEIRWMVGGKKLTIGTSSSEWVGVFVEDGTALRVQFDEETTHGSAAIQPSRSAYTIPFVQRSRQAVREMVFDFNSDAYVATDLNLFSSHIGTPYGRFADSEGAYDGTPYILQMAFQESPFNILWVIDNVGRLYGITRDRQQQVAAWHSHVIGGKISSLNFSGISSQPDFPAFVTSICTVPDPSGQRDRLWMVVKRDCGGTSKYFLEYMDDVKAHSTIYPGDDDDIKVFLDFCSVEVGSARYTCSGLDRFGAGDQVYVVATYARNIVFSGLLTVNGSSQVVLPVLASTIFVGLHANMELRPLPMEGSDAPEIKMRSLKKIDAVAIRMHQTWGLRIGMDRILRKGGNEENTSFEPIPFDSTVVEDIPTFTGIKEVQVPGSHDVDASFALVMQEPWPCTILSLSARVTYNEV